MIRSIQVVLFVAHCIIDYFYQEEYSMNKHDSIQEHPENGQQGIHQYISDRVFKDKSTLCRIAIPYIFEEPAPPPPPKPKEAPLPRKKIPKYPPLSFNRSLKPGPTYQKTPINEYLNYDLSEQINYGLKDVKVLADQIREIKETKAKELQKKEQKKLNKKVRIRRTVRKNYASATFLR